MRRQIHFDGFIMIDAIIFVDYEIKKNINNNKGKFKKRSGNGFVTHTDSIAFNLILPDLSGELVQRGELEIIRAHSLRDILISYRAESFECINENSSSQIATKLIS